MTWRAPRFVPIFTAVTVFCAHVLCACPAMWAKPAAIAAADATPPAQHHCCESKPAPHPQDAPAEPDRQCPHCDGHLVAPVAKAAAADAKAFAVDAVASSPSLIGTVSDDLVTPRASSPIPFASPPTLLRLRCALNL